MLIRRPTDLSYADVTPKSVYTNRREFLRAMGIAGTAAVVGTAAWRLGFPAEEAHATSKLNVSAKSPFSTTEKQTPYSDVTHYNNFYEFGTDKTDPAKNSQNFRTSPWSVSVEGEVKKPRKFSMDEILKIAPLEERIYRHRCVEAWSIVVPWIGFSFSELIKLVEPTPKAKYVAFETYFDLADRRHVWRNIAESGWRAGAHGGAVEVRLQEHQVHRENPFRRERTANDLESHGASRIRFLL
jgi:sulfoxide reductase catalytic subunit YedY